MFGDLPGGILPICVLAGLAGFALAWLPRHWPAWPLAALTAIAISYTWFQVPDLLWPHERSDPQGGWDLIATAFWSLFAVPTAVAASFLTRLRIARSRTRK